MKIKLILMVLMAILLSTGTMTTTSERSSSIHVYGEVELNGQSLANANITLQSQDRANEYHTMTNSNGEYDILASAIDHEDFIVFVQHGDGLDDEKWFETKPNINSYEINFEFQTNNDNDDDNTTIIYKTMSFFEGIWTWFNSLDLWELLWWIIVFLIIIILLIVLVKLLIPNGKKRIPVRQPRPQSTDNDTIILLTGNGKVKKIR